MSILKEFMSLVETLFEPPFSSSRGQSPLADRVKEIYSFLKTHKELSLLESILTASKPLEKKESLFGSARTEEETKKLIKYDKLISLLQEKNILDIKNTNDLHAAFILFFLLYQLSQKYLPSHHGYDDEKYADSGEFQKELYHTLELAKKSLKSKMDAYLSGASAQIVNSDMKQENSSQEARFLKKVIYIMQDMISQEFSDLRKIDREILELSKEIDKINKANKEEDKKLEAKGNQVNRSIKLTESINKRILKLKIFLNSISFPESIY